MEGIKFIALVPMKGNSERVPNKNLRNFAGKPLYHAIINTLKMSKFIKNIVVNTDSPKIKGDILNYFTEDVIVIDRPNDLIGDYVAMNEIINHDLSVIEGDYFIQTHSTNPLVNHRTIDKAAAKFISNQEIYDSIFAVTRIQSRLFDSAGSPINHTQGELRRTQDLDPIFEENSNFYFFSRESFNRAGKNRIGINPLMYEVEKIESIDIDEEGDFKIAEMLYKAGN
jgi:CMP-N-acetylneuraminic acid synthetase